jgi:hypothetical protein
MIHLVSRQPTFVWGEKGSRWGALQDVVAYLYSSTPASGRLINDGKQAGRKNMTSE